MRKEIETLWNLVEPHVEGAGLELVELDFGRDPSGWVLRVYIDRREGAAAPVGDDGVPASVGFDDCERVSRDVSAALDVADVITHSYRLEVSSPGLDRPLRRARDFARHAGQQVKLRTNEAVDGRRNFSGTIRAVDGGMVQVECDGRCYAIAVDNVARANLVPDWEAEFRKASYRSAS